MKTCWPKLIVGILIILLSGKSGMDVSAEPKEIVRWNRNSRPYYRQLLTLILENTKDKYGEYRLSRSTPLEQGQALVKLQQGEELHLLSTATTSESEEHFFPIRIPLSKGLIGVRVLLIREGEQAKFDNINSLQDWIDRGLTIGQGAHWPHAKILEANGVEVVKNAKYELLFKMLDRGRFDAFSRAVSEVIPEMERFQELSLSLEKNLLFVCYSPEFHFVTPTRPELARRIQEGFEALLEDGSFDVLFRQEYGGVLKDLHLEERTIIYLENPFLSEKSSEILKEPKYWYIPPK